MSTEVDRRRFDFDCIHRHKYPDTKSNFSIHPSCNFSSFHSFVKTAKSLLVLRKMVDDNAWHDESNSEKTLSSPPDSPPSVSTPPAAGLSEQHVLLDAPPAAIPAQSMNLNPLIGVRSSACYSQQDSDDPLPIF